MRMWKGSSGSRDSSGLSSSHSRGPRWRMASSVVSSASPGRPSLPDRRPALRRRSSLVGASITVDARGRKEPPCILPATTGATAVSAIRCVNPWPTDAASAARRSESLGAPIILGRWALVGCIGVGRAVCCCIYRLCGRDLFGKNRRKGNKVAERDAAGNDGNAGGVSFLDRIFFSFPFDLSPYDSGYPVGTPFFFHLSTGREKRMRNQTTMLPPRWRGATASIHHAYIHCHCFFGSLPRISSSSSKL
mmetsp:Transcript_34252/g.71631  ORF Transcript_34252/g.71631 Transcript_34252/m.71631 type:complete len:248 (-) Transcript_34252:19-762(-)